MSTAVHTVSLLTRLNHDWVTTHAQREHQFGTLGVRISAELLEHLRTTTGAAQDAVLYELVVLTHAGDHHAERLLVQLLLPAAQRMANRTTRLDDFTRTDRVGYAIGAAWESIRTYKLHRHARVHANLTMGMLALLAPAKTQNDIQVHDRTAPVSDTILDLHEWQQPASSPERALADLFNWAARSRVIDREEISLLSRATLGDETRDQIARSLDITVECLRKRVARIQARLATAAREQYTNLSDRS